ncbi:putative F420-dependent oxidoreductase [Tamaricihabitans halophyticus]|uniref:Putative F420-dependent oxidoreductase n=1 Tax=Tamaricihabitans halophyticus TaxID=1262583 RepID=A0A4R2QSF5_9PSEU|nr:LLM class F420-dependent oxidoreductase [Tamaricihabitans halophyticus]TCP49925.1 putative F420-dependent oxidoreductase [Tamaricihabitans halophyticus]
MRLGFGLPVCGSWATPDIQTRVARTAEQLGYHSLWTIQRLLYAHDPQDEYYGNPGAHWPEQFRSVADPTVSLAYVAGATERIRLGCAVYNAPFTNPVLFAKQLATLDVVSRGRISIGLGLGWSRDEYLATGASWQSRGKRFDEFLECVTAAWSQDEFEHRGTYFDVPRSSMAPRPVQHPHPPLLIGGHSAAALRRTVQFGQGYITGNLALSGIAPLLDKLAGLAESAGRDPAEIQLIGRGSTKLTPAFGPDGERQLLTGSPRQIVEDVRAYAEAGYDELFLDLNMDERFATVDADPQRCLDVALELLELAAPATTTS